MSMIKYNSIIEEDADELYNLFKKESNALFRDRLHFLYILKRDSSISMTSIAKELGRPRRSLYNWLSLYKSKGLSGYLTPRRYDYHIGKIRGEILDSLIEKLKDEEGFSSYGEIVKWLKNEHNLDMKYFAVYNIVRYKLKAKPKVARPVNIKKDPEKEEEFKKNYQK